MPAVCFRYRASAARQRGWVGLIVLLLALVIVAMLAQTVLRQYGMLPGSPAAPAAARQPGVDDRLRNPAIEAAPVDPTIAAPAPTNPIERARGVEDTLKRQVQDLDRQIDGPSK